MRYVRFVLFLFCATALSVGAAPVTLRVGKTTASFDLPGKFRAYESEKIGYRVAGSKANVGVEAVSFEDPKRTKGKATYDLSFPGDLSARIEYLGMMRPDATPQRPESDQIIPVRVLPHGERRWLLFRINNTGNTIWDTEGCCILFQFGVRPAGSGPWFAHVIHDKYVYPGESWDAWVPIDVKENTDFDVFFQLDWVGPHHVRLPAWTAKASFKMGEAGTPLTRERVPVEMSTTADFKHGLVDTYEPGKLLFDPMIYEAIPQKLVYKDHREFQSAYARPSGDAAGELRLMAAPWSKYVTLKLVTPDGIATKAIAIKPDVSGLKLKANPANTWTRKVNGKQMPLVAVKWMPFQSEWYLQPFLERRMRDQVREMQALGVGAMAVMAISVTPDDSKSEIYGQFTSLVKVCRELKMPVIWWGGYMFDHGAYERWSGLKLHDGGRGAGEWEVDLIDPNFPQAVVSMVDRFMAQNKDTSYVTADGKIPLVFDCPIGLDGYSNKQAGRRFGRFLTDLDKSVFRKWLEVKYIDVDHMNAKWGTTYKGFEEITPVEYGEATPFETLESAGMIDWDDYCSEMFTKQFGKIADAVHAKYPNVLVGYLGEQGTMWGAELTDSPMAKQFALGARCEAFQTRDMLAFSKCDFVGEYTTPRYIDEFKFSCEFLADHGKAQFYVLRPMHSGGDLPPLFPAFKAQWESKGPALVYGFDPGGIAHLTETQKREIKFFASLVPGR